MLTWSAPPQNTDGSPLIDLAGYRVYHGTAPSALNEKVQLQGANQSSYTFANLTSGTHYFAVAAYNAAGVEGERSPIRSKAVP